MNYNRQLQALIVEDDPQFSLQLGSAFEHIEGDWKVRTMATGSEALDVIEAKGFYADIVLVDIGLPDIGGLEIIRALHQRCPKTPILVVSVMSAERTVLSAIKCGASGYLLKDKEPQAIANDIKSVLNGEYPISPSLARYLFRLVGAPQPNNMVNLTTREKDVLQGLAAGNSYQQIAEELNVSLSTIQSHIRTLYGKLEAHSQVQAINQARDLGLL